jgi:hypothetical protein
MIIVTFGRISWWNFGGERASGGMPDYMEPGALFDRYADPKFDGALTFMRAKCPVWSSVPNWTAPAPKKIDEGEDDYVFPVPKRRLLDRRQLVPSG